MICKVLRSSLVLHSRKKGTLVITFALRQAQCVFKVLDCQVVMLPLALMTALSLGKFLKLVDKILYLLCCCIGLGSHVWQVLLYEDFRLVFTKHRPRSDGSILCIEAR